MSQSFTLNNKENEVDVATLKNLVRGPIFPIVTPFRDNGTLSPPIDRDALERYTRFLVNGGAKVLMVASATSRFAQISLEEIALVNRIVTEVAGSDALVVASTPIAGSTADHIRIGTYARESGARILMCEYPWRYQSKKGLVDYFNAMTETGLAIMLHVTPGRSEVATSFGNTHRFDIDALEEICSHPQVIGMKEASGDKQHSKEIWSALRDKTNIIVAGRASETFWHAYSDGYAVEGYFTGIGNVFPEKDVEVFRLIANHELMHARQLVEEETAFLDAAKPMGWHAALKGVLAEMGLMELTERAPMVPIAQKDREELVNAFVHGRR